MTPCHHSSTQQGSESPIVRRSNLLNVLEFLLQVVAVTTETSVAPGHDTSIGQRGSESRIGGLDVDDISSSFGPRARVG